MDNWKKENFVPRSFLFDLAQGKLQPKTQPWAGFIDMAEMG